MKNRRISTIVLVVVLLVCIIPVGYAAVSKIALTENSKVEEQTLVQEKQVENAKTTEKLVSVNDTVKAEKQLKKEVDTSNVKLSKDIEDQIKSKDSKNMDKYIENYKKMIVELDVPDKYRKVIEKEMKKKHKIPDILIAYDFLSDNYGLIDELPSLLDKKEKGITWAEVFKEYKEKNKEFIPTDFEPGYLENLMKTSGIAPEDMLIADRLSQKGIKSFNDLIEAKKGGSSWKEIKTSLGVVNTAEKLPRMTITSEQVNKFTGEGKKDTKQLKLNAIEYESTKTNNPTLSKEQVVEALVIAGKMNIDGDQAVEKLKDGKSTDELLAEIYEEKYN